MWLQEKMDALEQEKVRLEAHVARSRELMAAMQVGCTMQQTRIWSLLGHLSALERTNAEALSFGAHHGAHAQTMPCIEARLT